VAKLQEVKWSEEMSLRRKQAIPASDRWIIGREGGTPACEKSVIVFFGDAQQVSAGFALALSAMEANADVLMMSPGSIPEKD
jgi:pyruvate/2-oxoacid:ferredoxin oxidoreductase beta subunit